MKIWNEFKLIFRNSREVHRVLVLFILAALTSHVIHLYIKTPKGVPITDDQVITLVLGSILYIGSLSWCFLSNQINAELTIRFIWGSIMGVLGHRLIIGQEQFGTWFYTVVSLLAIIMIMVFVASGKTKNDLLQIYNDRKKKQNANVIPISRDSNTG